MKEDLRALYERGEPTIGIVGLGYVGLPLALSFAEAGLSVLGFDSDREKVAALGRGELYIRHLDPERLRRALEEERFAATADTGRLGEPDAVLICVPTPLADDGTPDLGFVESTAGSIARVLRRGQLVILESTTYPGTTAEIVEPILEAGSGLTAGEEFLLAYSPEREDPGNPDYSTTSIPKVVGAADPLSGDLAEALYSRLGTRVVRVSSTAAAEATKLTENIYRAVNIALVNELKMIYDRLGIDVWEVLAAAETKPFGFQRFDPGPGWGGHCIPIDPFYLAWRARQAGARARFVELAGEINTEMPSWVLAKLEGALSDRGIELEGARVLLLGVAYKPDVDDPRESPAFELLDSLIRRGARVAYHDPHVPRTPSMRSWPDLPRLDSEELTAELVESVDAAVVVTHHRAIDWGLVARHARLIVDARGVYRDPLPHVVRA